MPQALDRLGLEEAERRLFLIKLARIHAAVLEMQEEEMARRSRRNG